MKKKNELEGFIVLMWLCDLGLGFFETKNDLWIRAQELYPDQVINIF